MTNNEKAFNAFFEKLNGKAYTNPQQMKNDFDNAIEESGLKLTKRLTFGSGKKKEK